MSNVLLSHFVNGSERTQTGAQIGVEIETDFVSEDGLPPHPATTHAILQCTEGRPAGCDHKLEVSRAKFELVVAPQRRDDTLLTLACDGLQWLYRVAARWGLRPRFSPEFESPERLLLVTNERNAQWLDIDGPLAVEELCRCSSVQFTIDVHPADAISCVNALWRTQLHTFDYAPNTRRWNAFIASSLAAHSRDRFGGPPGFADLSEYVARLNDQPVLIHRGQRTRLRASELRDLDVDQYLKSVWWHYRLRRFGETLALEVRPTARRGDEDLAAQLARVRSALAL